LLVLIDESGDPGFKLTKGSSPFFVVAMVLFRDFEEAERTSLAIGDARKLLRVKPEFKFNKSSDPVRDGFFDAIQPFDFSVRAVVVKKSNLYSKNLRSHTKRFYNYFVQILMKHDNGALVNARIKIDGSGSIAFQRELKGYLRQQLGQGKIKSFKFVDSRRDNLVQLADMVVGAIARSYRADDRTQHNRWRQALKPKIENVWDFR